MKRTSKVLVSALFIVGLGAVSSPVSADDGSWIDGTNAHSNCFYETERLTLQYVTYEKWCNVDFNPLTVWLRGVQDGGLYKVEEGKTDIYDTNFERTFDVLTPFMMGQIW